MYGVPWEVACGMFEEELEASLIICGQHGGGIWDWHRMRWAPPKEP